MEEFAVDFGLEVVLGQGVVSRMVCEVMVSFM